MPTKGWLENGTFDPKPSWGLSSGCHGDALGRCVLRLVLSNRPYPSRGIQYE